MITDRLYDHLQKRGFYHMAERVQWWNPDGILFCFVVVILSLACYLSPVFSHWFSGIAFLVSYVLLMVVFIPFIREISNARREDLVRKANELARDVMES